MSTLEEKLERSLPTTGEAARRKLSSLEPRLGYRVERADKDGPSLVSIQPMDIRTYWRRVSRVEGKGKKRDAVMEFEREERNG
jgi:hypothetical protein